MLVGPASLLVRAADEVRSSPGPRQKDRRARDSCQELCRIQPTKRTAGDQARAQAFVFVLRSVAPWMLTGVVRLAISEPSRPAGIFDEFRMGKGKRRAGLRLRAISRANLLYAMLVLPQSNHRALLAMAGSILSLAALHYRDASHACCREIDAGSGGRSDISVFSVRCFVEKAVRGRPRDANSRPLNP